MIGKKTLTEHSKGNMSFHRFFFNASVKDVYHVSIQEGMLSDNELVKISANDKDSGANGELFYRIIGKVSLFYYYFGCQNRLPVFNQSLTHFPGN